MSAPRIVVVGAGPAGMMAAVEAHRRGCAVSVIDEGPRPGGQIYRQSAEVLGRPRVGLEGELERKETILTAFADAIADIDYRANATAYAVFPGPEVHVADGERSYTLGADALVLATGVSERAIPFPGWTLPGILYAGGVQAVMKAHGVRAGDRIAVVGAGPLPIAVAAQLVEAGATVVCVALLRPLRVMARKPLSLWAGRAVVAEGRAYLRTLGAAGVDVLEGWIPVRADGTDAVQSLTIARCDPFGRPVPGTAQRLEVDLVAMNFGFTVNGELARMAGAEVRFDPARGGWVPERDDLGRTSAARVFVAGDAGGLRGAWVAATEGTIVGAAAAAVARGEDPERLRVELAPAFAARRRHERFQEAVRLTLALPAGVWSWADGETVICRCENVTRAAIEDARAHGLATVDAIKRNTRAGMGPCGGRTCLAAVAAIVGGGTVPVRMPAMRARPPARPVTIAALARRPD